MKIAIILNNLSYPDAIGGAELFVFRMAEELGKRGHEIYLLAYSGKKLHGHMRVGSFKFLGSPFKGFRAQPFILINLLKINVDVCLAISFKSVFPVVINYIMLHTPSLVHYVGSDLYRLGEKLNDNNIKSTFLKCFLFWLVKRRFIHIALNKYMTQTLYSLGISNEMVKIVPNPIDKIFFKFLPNYEGNIVGYVGRLEYIKGCDILIKAFSIVKKNFPNLNLVLLGDGSLKKKLINLTRDLDIQDSVFITGFVPYEEVPLSLSKFSLFVLPSRSEGMPNALLQAMAEGLPIVASRVGGIPELIDQNINGLLVPSENPHELAKAIELLVSNKKFAKKMGKNARKKAYRYSLNRIVQIYEKLLEDIINSQANSVLNH